MGASASEEFDNTAQTVRNNLHTIERQIDELTLLVRLPGSPSNKMRLFEINRATEKLATKTTRLLNELKLMKSGTEIETTERTARCAVLGKHLAELRGKPRAVLEAVRIEMTLLSSEKNIKCTTPAVLVSSDQPEEMSQKKGPITLGPLDLHQLFLEEQHGGDSQLAPHANCDSAVIACPLTSAPLSDEEEGMIGPANCVNLLKLQAHTSATAAANTNPSPSSINTTANNSNATHHHRHLHHHHSLYRSQLHQRCFGFSVDDECDLWSSSSTFLHALIDCAPDVFSEELTESDDEEYVMVPPTQI